MKNRFPVHPLFFATYPVLALFAHNQDELLPRVLVPSLVACICGTLLIWTIAQVLVRDVWKSALLVSILTFFVFSYNSFFYETLSRVIDRHRFVLLLWSIALLIAIGAATRTRRHLRALGLVLNGFSIVLVLLPLGRILWVEIPMRSTRARALAQLRVDPAPLPDLEPLGHTPDIYYFVLDRYPHENTLRQVFDFDNTKFLDSLRARGFHIPSHSRANYATTPLSLASSLNMVYLDELAEILGENSSDSSVLFALIQDHRVQRLLRNRGYQYVHFGTRWLPTQKNSHADLNVAYEFPFSSFSYQLVITTVAFPLFYGSLNSESLHRNQLLYKLSKLPEIARRDGPQFVFAHLLIPHSPYVFDRDGSRPTRREFVERDEKTHFVNQLVYINRRIEELVDEILANSTSPPVILIQSDEGPHLSDTFAEGRMTEETIKTKTYILNAMYLPGIDSTDLASTMTPVNTFRLVFSRYFGANYPLLDDKVYWFEDPRRPYRFVDVSHVTF